jgi:hypothetical protein
MERERRKVIAVAGADSTLELDFDFFAGREGARGTEHDGPGIVGEHEPAVVSPRGSAGDREHRSCKRGAVDLAPLPEHDVVVRRDPIRAGQRRDVLEAGAAGRFESAPRNQRVRNSRNPASVVEAARSRRREKRAGAACDRSDLTIPPGMLSRSRLRRGGVSEVVPGQGPT